MTDVEQIDGIFGVIDLWASNAVRKRPDGDSVYNPYNAKELAVELYNADYRKADEVHKETAEKIFKMLISKLDSNQFLSGKRIIMEVDVENLAKQFDVEMEE